MHEIATRSTKRTAAAARTPISAVWASITLGLLILAVGTWIAILALRLQSINLDTATSSAPLPYAVAELARLNDSVTVKIQGSPNARVLLIADGVPVRVLELDSKGRGVVDDADFADGVQLEIAALAEDPEIVPSLPTLTPTATHTPTASPSPTATRSPPPTSTPPTPSPTVRIPTARVSTAVPTARAATNQTPRARRNPTEPAEQRLRSSSAAVRDRPTISPPVLHLVTDAGARIAVTFDGNASSNGTSDLLDLLHELDLDITLFVTGGFVERYPTLVRRAVLAGHEVGNHTYSHPHLTTYADNGRHALLPTVTKESFQDQLKRTEIAFRKATGRPMAPLWRAPFGEENSTLRGWALELGYLHIRWSSLKGASLDSLDWIADEHSKLYRDSEKMVDRLLRFPRLEGGIVLMHLATERSEPPWSDLPRFVTELRKRDVRPVKVSELLENSKTWRTWLERARKRHDEVFPE